MAKHSATLRYLRIAPRKVRLVADSVRGLSLNEAEARLLMQSRRAAKPILKLIRSAMAGAKAKEMELEKLYIASIQVDQGPMLKRFMPRARGGASEIQKKMSHVTVTLGENPSQKVSRFVIAPVKKKKSPEGGPKASRRPKAGKPEEKGPEQRREGFFRRRFSRKTASGS